MIRRALIVDLETTGIDPQRDEILEIGAILYDVHAQTTLVQFSTLLATHVRNAAIHINNIPDSALLSMFDVSMDGEAILLNLLSLSDVVVGHNCLDFDRLFLAKMNPVWGGKPWVCTKTTVTLDKGRPGDHLVNLALSHGIGVSSAHRALTDCSLIAAIFDRQEKLEAKLQAALRPRHLFRALVEYDRRSFAKDAGFSWDGKWWTKRMCEEDVAGLPFNVARVG